EGKLYFLLITVFFSCNNNWAKDKLFAQSEYYSDGKIKADYYIKNNKLDSIFITYYPSGNKESKSFYSEGKRVGESIQYYESGCLMTLFYYKNDHAEGEATAYFDGCQGINILKRKGSFRNGKKEGVHYAFNVSGDTISVQEYKDNVLIKEQKKQ